MGVGLGLGLSCAVIWLLLSGYFTNPLLLTLGAFSCVLVVYIARRMRLFDADDPTLALALRFLAYLPWLIKEVILANIDVTRRILHPQLPISPQLIRVRASQRGDLARTIFANSITLTPGTLSVTVDADEITVHALSRDGAEALEGGEMDRRVSALEGSR